MKNLRNIIVVLVILAMLSLFAYFVHLQDSQSYAPKMGEIEKMEKEGLPDFSAVDINGQTVNLKSYQGKAVIVSFWASWCGPCVEEFPDFISMIESTDGKVELIAISEDSSEEELKIFLKAFPKYQNKNIHIVWDKTKQLGESYDVSRLPESFVANKDLKLVKKVVGAINWNAADSKEFLKSLAN